MYIVSGGGVGGGHVGLDVWNRSAVCVRGICNRVLVRIEVYCISILT